MKDQQLLHPEEWYFKKCNFSEREVALFEVRYVREKWMKEPKKIFVFMEPWRFVLRVRPNIITKTRVRDEEIEKRIHAIDNFLNRNSLEGKMYRLMDGSYRWTNYNEKVGEKNPIKKKSVLSIMDMILEEDE